MRVGVSLGSRFGLGLMRAPHQPMPLVLGNSWVLGPAFAAASPAGAAAVARASPAPSLPHWNRLKPGRLREYTGEVYDTSIVKRIYPDEIYGWEHEHTTAVLIEFAANDSWESHAVPPVHLAYSEQGLHDGRRTVHYAIVDGHHRLNAALDATRRVGAPVGLPSMVTSRWEPNENGQLVGYGRMPFERTDQSLPAAWNRSGRPLEIHAPETIAASRVWGSPQITLTLPGSSLNLSLYDVADKLNAFKRPDEFLDPDKGQTVQVLVTLQDVYGRVAEGRKNCDARRNLTYNGVDLLQTDWRSILKDQVPLKALFGTESTQGYPIIQIDVQQHKGVFLSRGW